MSDFLAVAREPVYSPGKVEQDRAILEAVAQCLSATHTVRVVEADEQLRDPAANTIVLTMCQGPEALARLRCWQNAGVRIVNAPHAIGNCHRRRTLAAFERCEIAHPPSLLVSTASPNGIREWAKGKFWLKRGDVHAVQPQDVVLVHDLDGAAAALREYRRRGITDALAQRHIDGDVFKFYAVHRGFFHWLAANGSAATLAAEEEQAMAELARRGAAALGLEVYGGDCVRDRDGRFWLIDLNDWPSYAACRTRAAAAIAVYIDAQTRPKTT